MLRANPLEVLIELLPDGSIEWVEARHYDGFTWFYVLHAPDSSCGILTGNSDLDATFVDSAATWIVFDAVEKSQLLFWITEASDKATDVSFGVLGVERYWIEIDIDRSGRAAIVDGNLPQLSTGSTAESGLSCRAHTTATDLSPRP